VRDHEQQIRREQARQLRAHLAKYAMTMNPNSVKRHEARLADLERTQEASE
jgi:hypothetical protein